jgi:hypothetical protein
VTIELEQAVHAHVTVYSFEVKHRSGCWPMAFGSADQANAFLMGMFIWMRMSSRSWSFGLPKDVDAIEWQAVVTKSEDGR